MHPRLAPTEEAFHLLAYAIVPQTLGLAAAAMFLQELAQVWPNHPLDEREMRVHDTHPYSPLPCWRVEAHLIRDMNHRDSLHRNAWRQGVQAVVQAVQAQHPEVTWLVLEASSQPGEPGLPGKKTAELFMNEAFLRAHPDIGALWVQRDTLFTRDTPDPSGDFFATPQDIEDFLVPELRSECRQWKEVIEFHFAMQTNLWRQEALNETLAPAPLKASIPRL